MKGITFFHRTINFTTSGKHQKSGFLGALAHDTRLSLSDSNTLNHNKEMSKYNQFFYVNKENKITTEPVTQGCFERVAKIFEKAKASKEQKDSNPDIVKMRKLQNTQSAIRTKFKRYKVDGEAKIILESLGNPKLSIAEITELRDRFKNVTCRAHNSKLKQIQNYIEKETELKSLSNSECNSVSFQGSHFSTAVQAGVLKIPSPNGIDSKMVSNKELAIFFLRFCYRHFRDYGTPYVIGHMDELSVNPKWSGTGNHIHTYMSGFNKKTKKLDLLQKQKEFAERYLRENNPKLLQEEINLRDFNINSHTSLINSTDPKNKLLINKLKADREKVNGVYFGRIWQEALRIDLNKMLMNPKGLHIDFNYNTRNNKLVIDDSNRTQKNRLFSRSTQKIEQQKNQMKHQNNTILNNNKIISNSKIKSKALSENINKLTLTKKNQENEIANNTILLERMELNKRALNDYNSNLINKDEFINNIYKNTYDGYEESSRIQMTMRDHIIEMMEEDAKKLLNEVDMVSKENQEETHLQSFNKKPSKRPRPRL